MESGSEEDRRWMRHALGLAARARGRTAPNPLVGAVVVRGGQPCGRGYHARAGQAHAEARALEQAGERARDATLYVTLEPCAHHGRTPPCVDAVLTAGLARVVIGMEDPDPRTAGRGVARLRERGIETCVGVEGERCRALNRGYLSRVERGRPQATLKLAASLDGRIATRSGESRWITGEAARAAVHRMRARVDAICVGSATARADDPELTARRGGRVVHAPVRIVVDSRLSLSPGARLLRAGPPGSAWVLARRGAPDARRRALEAAGARVIELPGAGEHVDLAAAFRELAARGVNDLWVEGGGGLGAALLRAGLIDDLYLFTAPLLIGEGGRPLLGDLDVERLSQALRFPGARPRRVGEDWLWRLPLRPGAPGWGSE